MNFLVFVIVKSSPKSALHCFRCVSGHIFLNVGVAEFVREEYWQDFIFMHHRKFGVLRFESLD